MSNANKTNRMGEILRARKKRMLVIFITVLALTITISLIMPKTFVGEATVVVNAKSTDPVTGAVDPDMVMLSYLATQVDVINSHNVALKVVDKLKLTTIPDLISQFQEDTGGAGSIRDWLADKLLVHLDVKPSRESNVITIDYSGRDPQFVATVANAFADAYIQTNLELQAQPARRQASWYQEQVGGLRKALETSQQKLSDFQRSKGVAGSDDRLDIEAARLAELSSQLAAAQASAADADTHYAQMKQATESDQLEQLPDMLGNQLLQSQKADLVRAEGKLAELAQRVDRSHPLYVGAASEISELKARLRAELTTAAGSVHQAAEMAHQRVAEVQAALQQQKVRILQLKQQHDQLDVLNRDVQDSQHAYDAGVQRTGELTLQGQLDQSSVAVLSPAYPPLGPKWPKLILNIAIAVVMGGLLAVGAALRAEERDRRVRSSDDIVEAVDLLVLAEIPRLLRPARA